MDRSTQATIIAVILLILVIWGFGIADLVIYTQGIAYTGKSQSCAQFPFPFLSHLSSNFSSQPINITFKAKKYYLSQWKWAYGYESLAFGLGNGDTNMTWNLAGKIEQKCPTLSSDVNLYLDGGLVARSDGKILTTVSKTYIRDCHGTILYVTRAGNAFITLVNNLKITVSLEVRDATDQITLAYAEGHRLFEDHVDIKDAITGQIVANIQRQQVTFPWIWTFTIYNGSNAGADPRLLSLLAGKLSFTGTKGTDGCNQFFFDTSWLLLAVGILFVCGAIFLCWIFFKFREGPNIPVEVAERQDMGDFDEGRGPVRFHTTDAQDPSNVLFSRRSATVSDNESLNLPGSYSGGRRTSDSHGNTGVSKDDPAFRF